MIERSLGKGGLRVSAVGLGCMGMSEFYDPHAMDDAESIRVIHRYLDAGGNFLDTADMYGVGRNEELVGRAIRDRRRRGRPRHQVRQRARTQRRIPRREGRPAIRPRVLRRQPEAPRRWTRSTCITSTGSIPRCRSRTPSARWPSW